jgi:hypothetical protein
VQAGDGLDPDRITELGDDGELPGVDAEEAQGSESQTEQAKTDERADPALAERDSLLSALFRACGAR